MIVHKVMVSPLIFDRDQMGRHSTVDGWEILHQAGFLLVPMKHLK